MYDTQLANTRFGEILDLTAAVFNFIEMYLLLVTIFRRQHLQKNTP